MSENNERTPWWMGMIIAAMMIPALILPFSMNGISDDPTVKYLTYFYPAYVIATGICAWMCYPQRKTLAWILLVLMLLSHAAMLMLNRVL